MAARNKLGRVYLPGRPLPNHIRQEIIRLSNSGLSNKEISRQLQISNWGVQKIIEHFQRQRTVSPFSQGGSIPYTITDNILQMIEIWKLQKPSVYAYEIRERLLLEGICNIGELPSAKAINQCLRGKLEMTHKKISSIPREQTENIWKVDEYLDRMHGLCPTKIHFFDESSVVKTTSNRMYGNSYKGTQAIEIQRYASNATYTVNLLHSVFGVDYFNILLGSSNGEEMIAFFNYALNCVRDSGLPVFMHGDIVVMDNCGFHHGRLTETTLRQMFAVRGVRLIFQPPYSPHLNTCELCFHQMKQALRCNETYAQQFTEMAIIDGLNNITASDSVNYFHHCGYLY